MQSTPSPRINGRVPTTVHFLPPDPGMQSTPSLRIDGRVTTTVDFLPPEPDVQSTPSPREDGRVTATVGFYHRNRLGEVLQVPVKLVALVPP